MSEPLTITLSPELADKVRAQAAAHGYASESEYVEDQIAEAVHEDSDLEEWLRTVAVARYDAYDANPSVVLTVEELRARIAEHRGARRHADRSSKG
jgi:Arc/MetJ-type ribon-helix-helix transcriptional regulator